MDGAGEMGEDLKWSYLSARFSLERRINVFSRLVGAFERIFDYYNDIEVVAFRKPFVQRYECPSPSGRKSFILFLKILRKTCDVLRPQLFVGK